MKTTISLLSIAIGLILGAGIARAQAGQITLGFTPSTSPDAAGSKIYWGVASHSYTNQLTVAGAAISSITVTGLVDGVTYYFGATSYNSNGIEGPFSNEATYAVPTNTPPTMALIPNVLFINYSNATPFSVPLTGITAGLETNQTITITATTSNTNVVRALAVSYTSPATTGALTGLVSVGGTATNTVTVSDGITTVTRTFVVTVAPAPPGALVIIGGQP
jgi:hypothetical protein